MVISLRFKTFYCNKWNEFQEAQIFLYHLQTSHFFYLQGNFLDNHYV